MIAQNTMKVNGKWFYAGEEITEVVQSASDFSDYMNPPEECELPFVTVPNEKKYTKTEINRMSTAELKAFAMEHEVNNAEKMTGAELKKVLIEKLVL